MDAEFPSQAFEMSQELAATEPALPSHARNWLQEFAAMDAEFSLQASWSLHEPAATVPLLPLQASGPVQPDHDQHSPKNRGHKPCSFIHA